MPTMEGTGGAGAPSSNRCAQCNATGVPLLACDDPDVAPKGSSGAKPRFCNKCMIGKKVSVFWPVDESWYTGTVQEYDANSGEHLLCYQDGDTEWVKIGENTPGAVTVGADQTSMEPLPPMDPVDFKQGEGDHPGMPAPLDPSGMPDRMRSGNDNNMGPPGGYPMPPGGMPFPPGQGPPPPPYRVYNPYGGGPMFPPQYGSGGMDMDKGPDGLLKRKAGPKAWSKDEDQLLLSIVQKMKMPIKWSVVAQSLTERTGKQCRERYVNHLNPRLKTSDWSPIEDTTIFHYYGSMGSHWAKMSKIIPGRTDNGIKNRFHNLRRQYEREDDHRLRLASAKEFGANIRMDRMRELPKHLRNKNEELWDIHKGIGVLASQSMVVGESGSSRNANFFGQFRDAKDGDICVRCGLMMPSVQTGKEICSKTGWCLSCTRMPPHVSENLLRECLNLRRADTDENRKIVESWEEFFAGDGSGRVETAKVSKSDVDEATAGATESAT